MARHGTARHGIIESHFHCTSMNNFFEDAIFLLLIVGLLFFVRLLGIAVTCEQGIRKIGRKIDHSFCKLISFHRDLRGKYPLYRVLEKLSRLILSLPFRIVPGLRILRVWVVCLNWVYIWTPKEPLWFGIPSFMMGVFLADRTVSFLCQFPWFKRIIGE